MKLSKMRLKFFWISWLLSLSFFLHTDADSTDEDASEQNDIIRSVYFPALPEAFSKDFGSRASSSGRPRSLSKALGKIPKTPPVSSPKPTTTTEKLPLAQENHYAQTNSVTEAPGPIYLTESVYHHPDHPDQTPSPNRDDAFTYAENQHSLEERERENFGLFLQSVSSFRPEFNGNRIILDPLINPASMHYIPEDSEEGGSELILRPLSAPSGSELILRPLSAPAEKPEEFVLSAEETDVRNHFTEKSELSNSQQTHFTGPVERPQRIRPTKPEEREDFRPSSKVASFRPLKSKGFLPKPAANPFESRISRPVVNAAYDRHFRAETTTSPAEIIIRSTTRSTYQNPHRKKTNIVEPSFVQFGERKQKQIISVETQSSSEQVHRDYGFDFSSASISTPRKKIKPPSATSTPVEDAPVYRTSTKSYRAPTSLFQIRDANRKVVTAPSQPDFIQTESNIYIPQEYDSSAIPGVAGIDYPVYSLIPSTDFACSGQEHPGLYADQSTKCQVFHICQEGGREDSFLCPNGTIFNQQYFVCDWWYNFSCESAHRFYSLNALIYELPERDQHDSVYS